MVFRWRRAFCTSLPVEVDSNFSIKPTKDQHEHNSNTNTNDNVTRSDFNINPNLSCQTSSTTLPAKSSSVPVTPKLHCKTSNNHKLFKWSSTPSSPRSPSPSPLSILKSNLRNSKNRCGLCLQSTKRGRGVAIFTAECSHAFHFPCISSYVKKKNSLDCPICGAVWKDTPLLSLNNHNQKLATTTIDDAVEKKNNNIFKLKVYNDDERLSSLTPKSRFNPIPESDESCDEVNMRLLTKAVVISSGGGYETHAIVLNTKAPNVTANTRSRASIDLVTVVDVSRNISSEKMQTMKRTMRIIVSLLSSSDRLSIVAFCSCSKRLLHLKRMTNTGKRAACRILEAMAVVEGVSNATDAVRKAVKVLEDRRDRNVVASIIVLTDVCNRASYVSTTRCQNVVVHTLNMGVSNDHAVVKTVGGLLNVTVQDLRLELGFVSGSASAEITAVYSYARRSVALGTSNVLIGEMCANEERELLIELKVPSSVVRVYRVLSARCIYKESVTQDVIYCKERALVVPHPYTVTSSTPTIQRLRSLFITTRALAESRRLVARNDLIGAYHMLISARAIVSRASRDSRGFVVSLEAELNELQQRSSVCVDDKGEPLTPTSAWRVAEKLAKVAVIKKSLNRISDLHGFEDARF
ncbi:hypothetical protein M8C21_002296 [Ambrosia artemisiifolia]|uniref:Uncharacterized protein n=1 Tax=Ambrosia artemisiifolia TaxID=4212 RepID=A0AAD5CU41_AMBAR|nr:hypothetical protein M8C21_002296 [Ambrosia artemisiifolia]